MPSHRTISIANEKKSRDVPLPEDTACRQYVLDGVTCAMPWARTNFEGRVHCVIPSDANPIACSIQKNFKLIDQWNVRDAIRKLQVANEAPGVHDPLTRQAFEEYFSTTLGKIVMPFVGLKKVAVEDSVFHDFQRVDFHRWKPIRDVGLYLTSTCPDIDMVPKKAHPSVRKILQGQYPDEFEQDLLQDFAPSILDLINYDRGELRPVESQGVRVATLEGSSTLYAIPYLCAECHFTRPNTSFDWNVMFAPCRRPVRAPPRLCRSWSGHSWTCAASPATNMTSRLSMCRGNFPDGPRSKKC
jgi:hypothetical protein